MELIDILSQSPIQDQICSHLSLKETVTLQKQVWPLVLKCQRFIWYNGRRIPVPGLTDLSVRLYDLFEKKLLNHIWICAVEENDQEVVKWLLDNFPNTNKLERTRRISALKRAAGFGNVEMMKLLLDNGTSVNSENVGSTALIMAAKNGQLAAINFLLDQGADINLIPAYYRHSPLIQAAQSDQLKAFDLLVQRGADLERDLNNAFIKASLYGKVSMLKYLFEISQKRNIPVSLDRALLGYPIGCQLDFNNPEISKDIEHYSEKNERLFQAIRFFLEKGANINARFQDLQTVLSCAVEANHFPLVRYLIYHGAVISANDDGDTPFHQVVLNSNIPILKLLLTAGQATELINAPDSVGDTALEIALAHGKDEIAQLLLEAGAT